jgi:hypothetical protein
MLFYSSASCYARDAHSILLHVKCQIRLSYFNQISEALTSLKKKLYVIIGVFHENPIRGEIVK